MVAEVNNGGGSGAAISQLSRARAAQGSPALSQETLEAIKNGALPPEVQESQTSQEPKDGTASDTTRTSKNISQEQTSLDQKLASINDNSSSNGVVIKSTANAGTLVDIIV